MVPAPRQLGIPARQWGVRSVFVRIRVFSKKLLTRSGALSGGDWGALGAADWMPIIADLEDVSGALPGEVAAARRSTISGRTAGAVGIREWGCVDIRSSVH